MKLKSTDKVARRLALLDGVDLSQAYLDAIVAELEEFAEGTPWVSQQLQPATNKA